jgi:hypothetical protein
MTVNVGIFALDSLFILIPLAVAFQMQFLAIDHVDLRRRRYRSSPHGLGPLDENSPATVDDSHGSDHLHGLALRLSAPVRAPSTQRRPENFLDDLSNSGPAVRLQSEVRATAPIPK